MSRSELALWVIFPYACLTTFALGHTWRYRRDRFNWTTRSTQLLERKLLRKGTLLFHVGLLMVIGGHVMGLVVPRGLTARAGVTDDMYHWVSVIMGTLAGTVMVAGFAVLVIRRLKFPRVAQNTSQSDRIIYTLLTVMVITGMLATVGINLIAGGYHYRETVSPWFRGIFTLRPDGGAMSDAPLVYQLHALTAMLVFAFWPFSRLVHAWSVPLTYIGRSPILYRSRHTASARPAVQRLIRRNGSADAGDGSAVGHTADRSLATQAVVETQGAPKRLLSNPSRLVGAGAAAAPRTRSSSRHASNGVRDEQLTDTRVEQ